MSAKTTSKSKVKSPTKENTFSPELLDELIGTSKTAEEILGSGGIVKELSKALIERMLAGEMNHHLGYEKYSSVGRNSGNSRNGVGKKTLKGEFGEMQVDIPRDRDASFDPLLIPKYQTRFAEFDAKIISLYARGMSDRDIAAQLEDLYGIEVSHSLISQVVSEVMEEVIAWQNRALDEVYPIVYFDALVVKVRQDKQVIKKHLYLALAINTEGHKELLGMWLAASEGAKFWLAVMNELKNRGLKDMLIACVDGLSGFPEAIEATYPHTLTQLCIVHMVRNSLRFVTSKDRKEVAGDLKSIYQSATVEQAEQALLEFSETWDSKYPMISQSWWKHWDNLSAFYQFPPEIRKIIYTTNAIESLNRSFRKVLKTKGSFPNDEAVYKLIYLSLKNIAKRWTMPFPNWALALNQFAILFPERLPDSL